MAALVCAAFLCFEPAQAKKQSRRAVTMANVVDALDSLNAYEGHATFSVSMPQLSDDVVYDVRLTQHTRPADRLLHNDYLIDWTLTTAPEGVPATGFSAYFDGNHYRHQGERLMEYHMTADSLPFCPQAVGSRASQGVHRQVQFFQLLPLSVAEQLHTMMDDDAWSVVFHPDTLISGRRMVAVNGVMTHGGVTAVEAEYVFDPATLMPMRIRLENNPGSISEQTVAVDYSDSRVLASPAYEMDEVWLVERYPDVFERLRESAFRIDNLPGTRLPAFALPTTTGERYSRRATDAMRAPTVVAILDAAVPSTPEVIAAVRSAIERLPYQADAIWAFTDNNVERIEAVCPQAREYEHLLMNAKSLARDCGVTATPVVIIVGRDGTVANVINGFNNDIASSVIQKMALLK